jgi:molecular chaperone GrpE
MQRSNPQPEQSGDGQDAVNASDAPDAATDMQEIEMSDEAAEIVKQLQAELDEAVEARKRALADFRNYQRRALESEQKALDAGMARVIRALMPVMDNFDLTLAQRPEQVSVEQLMNAVRMVRAELNKAMQSQGVQRIAPARGEPFDPHRHEAVMRQPADDVEPNAVVAVMQPGYALGELVLRPAKVSVAPSAEAE